jgi:hypothetical protein
MLIDAVRFRADRFHYDMNLGKDIAKQIPMIKRKI